MSRWDDILTSNPRLRAMVNTLQPYLPPLNYITVHYAYFLIVCIFSSIIFYLSSSGGPGSIGYVDSLFLVVSAMTEAGLNTVNLSEMNTWQQVILLALIMLGSTIWVSIWTVLARKHVFEKRFEEIVEGVRIRRLKRRKTEPLRSRVPRLALGGNNRGNEPLYTIDEERRGSSDGDGSGSGSGDNTLKKKGPGSEKGNEGGIGKKPLRRASTLPDLEHGRGPDNEKEPTAAPNQDIGSGSRPHGGRHIAFAGQEEHHPPSSAAVTSAYEHHSSTTSETTTRRRGVDVLPNGPPNPPSWSPLSFLSHSANVSRNAGFYNLTDDEKESIGGCEYRALKLLSWTVSFYFILWQALGGIALGAWINNHAALEARGNGANPWWSGIYYGVSAFNNSGMSLLDANMVPFQQSPFVLLAVGLLILAGNTAFPIFLRLTFWGMLKLADLGSRWFEKRGDKEWKKEMDDHKATLEFILQYPRRVYTNLFTGRATWWLFFMLIWLNGVDWVAFMVLNIGNKALESIPAGYRALDGLFQALAVRSGGFFVVPITDLYVGLQVVYAIMMYISVYPVVITMRHSNVYEERSLGIYTDEKETPPKNHSNSTPSTPAAIAPVAKTAVNAVGSAIKRTMSSFNGVGAIRPPPKPTPPPGLPVVEGTSSPEKANDINMTLPASPTPDSRVSFIRQQVHGQLAHDLWWLVAAVFIIVTIETGSFLKDPLSFSVFNVMFEVISAYGCVGISVGAPRGTEAYSFAGAWRRGSKLVLCLVMLRGRHRGLPVALDRAVRLPGEKLLRDEEEDWRIRTGEGRRRRASLGM